MRQELGRVLCVPARHIEQCAHLVNEPFVPRLAAFTGKRFREIVGLLGDRVAQPEQTVGAFLHRQDGPGSLRLACALYDAPDLGVRRDGKVG